MNNFNLIEKNNEYINQFHIFFFKILRTFCCLHFLYYKFMYMLIFFNKCFQHVMLNVMHVTSTMIET